MRQRCAVKACQVSTHAPARGATPFVSARDVLTVVSTHAPARGATRPTASSAILPARFQLTRPRGARPERNTILLLGTKVSTHAPARGATYAFRLMANFYDGFNSRAREGRDLRLLWSLVKHWVSTHAPARGATTSSPS